MQQFQVTDAQVQLLKQFALKKTVGITFVEEGKKDDVLAGPAGTLICADPKHLDAGFVEYLALAKLAEKDILLVTFYFNRQPEGKKQEFMAMFFELCAPLRDAWKYAMIRDYAESVYEERIVQLCNKYNDMVATAQKEDKDGWEVPMLINLHLIVKQDGRFPVAKNVFKGNDEYLEALENFCCTEPHVSLYQKLADISHEPYSVRITETVTPDNQPISMWCIEEVNDDYWQGLLGSLVQ